VKMSIEIDKSFLGNSYARFELALRGINTLDTQKSLQISLLTNSLQKLAVTSALMTNHKTIKNNVEYNYNFWEYKIPQNDFDFLICTCFENQDNKFIPNGWFIFPKNIINKLTTKNTLNIFESDISGNYSKDPKINKNLYFKNWKLLKDEKKV